MRSQLLPFRAPMLLLIASIVLSFVGSGAKEGDAETDHKGLPQEQRKALLTLFSCSVCDTLVEDVYRELEIDLVYHTKSHTRKETDPAGVATLTVGANETIERMLNPTKKRPGSAVWDAYTPVFRAAVTEELTNQRKLFTNVWKGIPIKTVRAHVMALKTKICGRRCKEDMPRHPVFEDSECGRCMEVMRDLSIAWVRTEKKTAATAWQTLEGVCAEMELRHDRELFDELTTTCEEVSEEYMHDLGLLDKLVGAKELIGGNFSPYTLGGYLISSLCMRSAKVCTRNEVDPQVSKFTKEAQKMLGTGLGLGLMGPKELEQYRSLGAGGSSEVPEQDL